MLSVPLHHETRATAYRQADRIAHFAIAVQCLTTRLVSVRNPSAHRVQCIRCLVLPLRHFALTVSLTLFCSTPPPTPHPSIRRHPPRPPTPSPSLSLLRRTSSLLRTRHADNLRQKFLANTACVKQDSRARDPKVQYVHLLLEAAP